MFPGWNRKPAESKKLPDGRKSLPWACRGAPSTRPRLPHRPTPPHPGQRATSGQARSMAEHRYPAAVPVATERPLLFLDVDGPLIPFGAPQPPAVSHSWHGVPPHPLPAGSNPLLARLNPQHGRRLSALPCDLVWTGGEASATTCSASPTRQATMTAGGESFVPSARQGVEILVRPVHWQIRHSPSSLTSGRTWMTVAPPSWVSRTVAVPVTRPLVLFTDNPVIL